jgi:hypothetical protein
MKLVIEIPRKMYEQFKIVQIFPTDKIIANGAPLDSVLDKIRAEFKSKADGDDWYHTTDGLVWEEAIEILDKYRGEQK